VSATTEHVTTRPPIEELARLVGAISAAAKKPNAVASCFDAFTASHDLFTSVILFKGGYAGSAFVIASSSGRPRYEVRSWMRWPLRRLFINMQPLRIENLVDRNLTALAVPFSHGIDRWLIIATMSDTARSPDYDAFFGALESLTVACGAAATSFNGEQPPAAMEPVITGFALAPELRGRANGALARRGWTMQHIAKFSELSQSLRRSAPDVVAIDASQLDDCVAAAAGIHRIAECGPVRVLAFDSSERSLLNSAGLVDRVLPHDSEPQAIFRAIKELALESGALRQLLAAESGNVAQVEVSKALSPQELAAFAARSVSNIVGGWAYCVLLNEYGAVYRAQSPGEPHLPMHSIPKAYLSGSRLFHETPSHEFLNTITDDPFERQALLNMHPTSAATIALVSEDRRHCGVIVACSLERRIDSHIFETLDRFGRVAGTRFGRLQPSRQHFVELRKERAWERLHDHMLHVDVYRSSGCTVPWRYRTFEDAWGLLTLGLEDDTELIQRLQQSARGSAVPAVPHVEDLVRDAPCFAATIDFCSQTMHYSSRGFSPPLFFEGIGPRATSRSSRSTVTGVATLDGNEAVICDGALLSWLRERTGRIERLAHVLESEQPAGFASVITLD
jgi:hypothetical protein